MSQQAMRTAQERVRRLPPEVMESVTEAVGRSRTEMDKPRN